MISGAGLVAAGKYVPVNFVPSSASNSISCGSEGSGSTVGAAVGVIVSVKVGLGVQVLAAVAVGLGVGVSSEDIG